MLNLKASERIRQTRQVSSEVLRQVRARRPGDQRRCPKNGVPLLRRGGVQLRDGRRRALKPGMKTGLCGTPGAYFGTVSIRCAEVSRTTM